MAEGKQQTKKLHHFVPQAYLRGFANEKERVTAVRLPGSRRFTTSVKNVAAETHFHRVEGIERPDEFEDVLGALEGEAQNIIRRIEGGCPLPLPQEDRWNLAFFIALQAVRGPDTRRTSELIRAKMIRLEVGVGGRANVAAWAKRNLGFEPTEEQAQRIWDEAMQPEGPPVEYTTLAHIVFMMETAYSLLPYIAGRPWSFHSFEKRALITCDSPVSLIADPSAPAGEGVGYATAWGIGFPMTRRLCLLAADPMVALATMKQGDPNIEKFQKAVHEGRADTRQRGTTAMENMLNDHTAASAREYIYHHPDDEPFVPTDLHEPRLVNVEMGGLSDRAFDGTPLFGRGVNASTSMDEAAKE